MDKLFLGKKENFIENNTKTVYTERFKILLPEVFGFCDGVINALKKLENIIRVNDTKNIYLLGEIIHNPTVNRYFASSGVNIIPESKLEGIYNIAEHDDYVVIPAFGIPILLEKNIRKKYKNIVDTTCRNVKSLWEFISSETEKDSTIILYGKPEHPEVKASISRVKNDRCIIILPDLETAKYFAGLLNNDLSTLEQSAEKIFANERIRYFNSQHYNPKRFALASQTTMLYNEVIEVEKLIRNATIKKGGKLFACSTICRSTYMRQKAALKICRQRPDLIFVVGGYESSNTLHLYKLAQKYSPVYYLKDDESIDSLNIRHFIPDQSKEVQVSTKQALKNTSLIAIFAGASCPFSVINIIIEKLKAV